MSDSSKTMDRISGVVTFLLMLTAFAMVSRRLIDVANGPLPLTPGAQAPEIRATYISGGAFELSGYKGQIVVLDFWATWCGPCVQAMPSLQKMSTKFEPSGVSIVGVNQEPHRIPHVRRFLRESKVTFPNVVDQGDIARTFGVLSFPTIIIVDHAGVIRVAHRGAISPARLEEDIKRLIELRKGKTP